MNLFRGLLTVSGRKLNRFRHGLRFRRERREGGGWRPCTFRMRRNRRKGLSVGNSVPGPRFLRPGEGGPQFPDRTERQWENRRFPQGRKTNPPASRTCRRMKKQSGKFPVLRGAFYCLAGPSMIALWLMFQPPPRAVYRETSVLACW